MSFRAMREQRRAVRLEIHGEISGWLLGPDLTLTLRDLSAGGFLAETTAGLPVEEMFVVRLMARDGPTISIAARCAHCRRVTSIDEAPRFVVGFQFVTTNPDEIDALLDRLTGSITFG